MVTLSRASAAGNLHVVDLPYRLGSWALDDPRNVGLWVDTKGHLLAWAVMQTPFCAIDYAFAPDTEPHLHRQLLAWADQRATEMLVSPDGNPCWFVNVFTDQPDRIHELDDAGFACQADVGEDSWSKVLLHRPAHLPVADNVPPPGFAIRPLAGEAEVEAYVALHRAVFESNSMTAAWRARTLHRPEYSPDIDLVAVAPDGRLAAFCICWIDDSGTTPRGQIEPLGVHEDFRHLGLGRALLSEGLRRLDRRGAESIYVETDKHRDAALVLYEAMGFRTLRDVLVYREDYPSPVR